MKLTVRFILLIGTVLSRPVTCWSQTDYNNPENIYRFAQYLYENGDYIRAAVEFERFLFLAPIITTDTIHYTIGKCYQSAGKFESALNYYQKIIDNPAPSDLQDKTRFQIALMQFEKNDYSGSMNYIKQNRPRLKNQHTALQMEQLFGINLLYRRHWPVAIEHFSNLVLQSQQLNSDSTTLALKNLALNGLHLTRKNALTAGIMSAILPGSGKIYAGKTNDALYSLVLIGLTGWQAYEGFQKNGIRSTRGWIYGTIGSIFYLGNIYGSTVAVKIYNDKIENDFFMGIAINFNREVIK